MSIEVKSTGLMADLPQSVSTRQREIPQESKSEPAHGEAQTFPIGSAAEKRMENLVESLNARLLSSALKFEVDPSLQTPIIKVVDTRDNKVIRQIPSEEALSRLEMIQRYLEQNEYGSGKTREAITGILFNQHS